MAVNKSLLRRDDAITITSEPNGRKYIAMFAAAVVYSGEQNGAIRYRYDPCGLTEDLGLEHIPP